MRHEVDMIARSHLTQVLKEYPGVIRTVLDPFTFNKWVELCRDRCNQLDLAGYVRSKHAMHDFVKKAANAYALARLDMVDKVNEEVKLKHLIKLPTDSDL